MKRLSAEMRNLLVVSWLMTLPAVSCKPGNQDSSERANHSSVELTERDLENLVRSLGVKNNPCLAYAEGRVVVAGPEELAKVMGEADAYARKYGFSSNQEYFRVVTRVKLCRIVVEKRRRDGVTKEELGKMLGELNRRLLEAGLSDAERSALKRTAEYCVSELSKIKNDGEVSSFLSGSEITLYEKYEPRIASILSSGR